MRNPLLTAAFTLMLASPALAAEPAAPVDKPAFSASRTISLSATVSAIDQATRNVTLTGEQGEEFSFTVGEDARNLGQVSVGDRVVAEIYQNVDVKVTANPGNKQPSAAAATHAARSELGDMPGGVVSDAVVISAIVEAIDLERNTFVLRGPEGNSMEFEAQNPENLRRSAVGDLVVITITQSLGIMVKQPAVK